MIQFSQDDITVFESSLYRTTSTVIAFDQSILIIDPTWLPIEIAEISAFVTSKYHGKKKYLLFTHSDYDHILGYGAFTDVTVIASESFVRNKQKRRIIKQISDFDNTYYIHRDYAITYPHVDMIVSHDNQKMSIDGHDIIFYLAPGHNSDGIFTCIPNKHCWIAGDYLSDIEMPFIDFSYEDYVKTLQKAQRIIEKMSQIHLLIPGHGYVATSRKIIQLRIMADLKYLDFVMEKRHDEMVMQHIKSYSENPNLIKAHIKNLRKIQPF